MRTTMQDNLTEAKKAYGEHNGCPEHKNTSWRGEFCSAEEFIAMLPQVIRDYNMFDSEDVIDIIGCLPKYEYALAREGSVAIYIKGLKTRVDVNKLKEAFQWADEFDFQIPKEDSEEGWKYASAEDMTDEEIPNSQLRIWWD